MVTLSPVHQRAALAGGAPEARMRVLQADRKMNGPFEWAFSGTISTQAHYDALYTWLRKPNPINVTIHNGRVYNILLKEFKPVDKRSAKNATRWSYEMTATVISRVS
jgi:hypothetical protein